MPSNLDQAVTLATRNYSDGGATYFLVLETTGQFLDARARELELSNSLRRAVANLDRSVGYRVAMISPEAPSAPPMERNGDDDSSLLPGPADDVLPAVFTLGGRIRRESDQSRNRNAPTARHGVLKGAADVGHILSGP